MHRLKLYLLLFLLVVPSFYQISMADDNYYYQYRPNRTYYPQYRQRRHFVKTITDYFGGQLTGFTPSINSGYYAPTQSYEPSYTNSNVQNYSTPWGRRGYRVDNFNTGTQSMIRVLD